MKKYFFTLISLVFLVSIFESCTLHKRVHQRGYHIAWTAFKKSKNSTNQSKETEEKSREKTNFLEIYQADDLALSTSISDELIYENQEEVTVVHRQDTVVPSKPETNEEYFDRRTNQQQETNYTGDLPGKEQANLALAFGIVAITAPIWTFVLIAVLAAGSSFALEAVAMAMVVGILLAVLMIVAALAMGISFLKKYGKDSAYMKYKQRAVTGIVLASIIPGIIFLSIILAIAMG